MKNSILVIVPFLSLMAVTGYLLFLSYDSLWDCRRLNNKLQTQIEDEKYKSGFDPKKDPQCNDISMPSYKYYVYNVFVHREVNDTSSFFGRLSVQPGAFPLLVSNAGARENFTAVARLTQLCVGQN